MAGGRQVARWEHFDHPSDIGVRGVGRTREEAFEQAALALTAVTTEPAHIRQDQVVEIECSGTDDELLFVDFLNAIVFEAATRKMLFARFQVRIEDGSLRAEAWGERVDVARHQPAVEVKGATLSCLKVCQEGPRTWVAQCVVDV